MNWKEFRKLLSVQSHSTNEHRMREFIKTELNKRKQNYTIDNEGNIFVTKGKASHYPCIASHIDTVHRIVPKYEVVRVKDIAFAMNGNEFTGIGGDDKCGIYACLHLLDSFKNIKVVFFSREEVGCQGSGSCDLKFFEDVGYIFQLDRWGKSDFIDSYSGEVTITEAMKVTIDGTLMKFGYKSATGLYTDVFKLWSRGVKASCVNISCGYYEHHTDREYINLKEFENSLNFTEELIRILGEDKYHPKRRKETRIARFTPPYSYNDYDDDYNDYGYHSSSWGTKTSSNPISVKELNKQAKYYGYKGMYDAPYYVQLDIIDDYNFSNGTNYTLSDVQF